MRISKSMAYELALSSINKEHINDFLNQYIPKVIPILTEYGARFLFNGTILDSRKKKFPARSFAVLEWPAIGQFAKINEDERIIPLMEKRNQYLDFILEGCFYQVTEDIDFKIPDHKAMTLLLSNRTILEDQATRLQWINSPQNKELSLNLYLSGSSTSNYEREKDVEEFTVQLF